MPKIKMSKMINPHFYKVWNTNKPYIILNGGRGSFKSSVISLKLATMVKKQTQLNHQVNFILIRENASYLHDSVYKQMEWAFTQLNMYNEFLYFKSPMRIVHKRTGSTFYFYGGDDPMKLKSNIVGNVMAVWYEEAANFKGREVFDQANPTFIRQKPPFIDHVTVYYSYNPPRNPYDWVNEWVEEERQDPDCLVDTSTYLDDERGFTNDEQLKLIERYKKNDYEYYRWLYLGEVVGLGTNIYNMDSFQAIDKLPDDDYITNVYYSVDTGHEVSATTCGAYGLTKKGNLILLDTYYYSPQGKSHKKPPSELSKDLKAFIDKVTEWIGKQPTRMTIDSAEGALDNQFYNDYGIHWHKVNKLKKVDMIDRVQDLLAQGRFYYLKRPENEIFIAEHQKYQWDENTLQSDDPKVIKEDDHTCDSFMYLCVDNERDFGLKW
ncbi:PBSX family phage terminase large subunit [Limosilactobacillus reuteri]|uniref:PBSX family phage terminase large subunit n=2 Tax=Limosilactobacillus reuteri TaxID=1598 RepID=UPI002B05E7B1|nr:PBSX family phage terminase large subunit [Limosilactobacillus reuteri]